MLKAVAGVGEIDGFVGKKWKLVDSMHMVNVAMGIAIDIDKSRIGFLPAAKVHIAFTVAVFWLRQGKQAAICLAKGYS